MHKLFYKIFLPVLIISAFSACGHYNKILKSKDMDRVWYEAKKYYEKGDCVKALALLEELVTVNRNTTKAESIYYYYAYANYCTEDYILAAYHFKNFSRQFPNSAHAEECLFMGAYAFSQESPRYSLDQTDTKNAIKEMQMFINKYPTSTLVDSCNHIIDRLRGKLERKSFEIAKQYYDIEDYKAAMIAFQNLIKEFPDTRYREEANFYNLKASYKYAYHSIETKKLSRLDNTIELYNKFIATYPSGKHTRDAQNILNDAQKLRSQLAYDIPRSLFDKGYYLDCIEICNTSLSTFPDHPKRQEVAFILLKATRALADISNGYEKEGRLRSVIATYDKTKNILTNEKYAKHASRFVEDAKKELDELPYTLPVYFHSKEDPVNAYASAKKTLDKFPDHPKKNEIANILLESGFDVAMNDWTNRKDKLDNIIKDYGTYNSSLDKSSAGRFEKRFRDAQDARKHVALQTTMHYFELKQYENALNYGLIYGPENSGDDSKLNYYIFRSAYEEAQNASDCPGKCSAREKAISLYDDMVKKGWSGKDKDAAEELYNKLIRQKEKEKQTTQNK